MAFTKFNDWLKVRESSAWTRRRKQATAGLQPDPPEAAVHSRSTAGPSEDYTKKKKKKKKGKKKKKKLFDEGEKKMQKNPKLAGFLDQIESLKGDLKVLEDTIDKKKKEPPKKPEPKEEPKDEKEPKEEPKPEEEPKEDPKEKPEEKED
jgi:hypothetical protein